MILNKFGLNRKSDTEFILATERSLRALDRLRWPISIIVLLLTVALLMLCGMAAMALLANGAVGFNVNWGYLAIAFVLGVIFGGHFYNAIRYIPLCIKGGFRSERLLVALYREVESSAKPLKESTNEQPQTD